MRRDLFCLHGSYGPDATPYGCTFVRLLLPLSHPSLEGRVRMRHGTALPADGADAVVLERSLGEGMTVSDAERLLDDLRRRGIPFVHTLDDDLLDLNANEPWKPEPTAETRRVVRLLLREASGVIVSTPFLARRVARLNTRVEVVPNALDERLFFEGGAACPRAPRGTTATALVTLGYMGTLTHEADLLSVLAPLRAVLRRAAGRVRFELVGGSARPGLESLFEGLPFRRISPGRDHSYPRFVGWMRRTLAWDAAIAPLVPTPFARSKSDLKFLDYGALGIPGVFTDSEPYHETVRHDENGLLADGAGAFGEAVAALVGNDRMRRRLGEAAREEVFTRRTLAVRAGDWANALESLLEPAARAGAGVSGSVPT